MSSVTEFDVGSFTWVKSEIDQALGKARQALTDFATNPAETTPLRHCQTHLHQVAGAFQMVALDALAVFSEEMEKLAAVIERREINYTPEVGIALDRAISAVGRYSDDLVNGEPNIPVRLFPEFRAMQLARGQGLSSESDLFFPDTTVPPRHSQPAVPMAASEMARFIKTQRLRFEQGLLKWLRGGGDAAGLTMMRESLDAIEAVQTNASARAFWWVAAAFAEILERGAVDADLGVKQICARIDSQMRRLAEGSHQIGDRLFRDVLFYIARAQSVSPRVEEIKRFYELGLLLPSGSTDGVGDEEIKRVTPILRDLRETLGIAKDAWVKFTSGNADRLSLFRDQTQKIATRVADLRHPSMAGLVQRLADFASKLPNRPEQVRESSAMEVATAILLLENALGNYFKLGSEFEQQSKVMAMRLQAEQEGRGGENIPDIPMLDEMSRNAQERMLLATVVQEIQANLGQIEQVLDGFFREPTAREELANLRGPIKQVIGALMIMELHKAVALLEACQITIESLANPDYAVQQSECELLAEALSTIGFYVQAIQHGQADREAIIDPLLRRYPGIDLGALGVAEQDATVETVEVVNVDEIDFEPTPEPIAELLPKAEQPIEVEPPVVVPAPVPAVTTPVLVEVSHKPVPGPIPAPKPEPVREQAAVDEELLEVYLEEATEVLSAVAEQIQVCAEDPLNREAQTVIRRGFHTLKGSGRMVGLTDLGEVAWAVEQVMNRWLQEERAATPALVKLIESAGRAFQGWVNDLQAHGYAKVEADELMAFAERLKSGDDEGLAVPVEEDLEGMAALEAEALAAEQEVLAAEQIDVVPEEVVAPVVDTPVVAAVVEQSAEPDVVEEIALGVPDEDIVAVAVPETEPFDDATMVVHDAEPLVVAQVIPEFDAHGDIVIGNIHLSPILFDIFTEEAREHIAALQFEYQAVNEQPSEPVTLGFMRAAHTLCGISRTTGFNMVGELAYALEQWLQELLHRKMAAPVEHLPTVGRAIEQLAAMLAMVLQRQCPQDANDLIRELQLAQLQVVEGRPLASAEQPPSVAIDLADDEMPGTVAEIPVSQLAAEQLPEIEEGIDIDASPDIEDVSITIKDDLDEQLLPIFLEEAEELFPQVRQHLRDWREDIHHATASQLLRRALHTLKGSARMAGAMRLGEATHHMESRVEAAIETRKFDSSLFDELDAYFDQITDYLEILQGKPEKPKVKIPAATGTTATVTTLPVEAKVEAAKEPEFVAPQRVALGEVDQASQKAILRIRADIVDRLVNQAGEVSIARSRIEGEMQSVKKSLQDLTENVNRLRAQLREIEIQAESQMQSRLSLLQETHKDFDPLEFDRFSRFQEITRGMAESVNDVFTVQYSLLKNMDEIDSALVQQARMSRDLQTELMHVRMVPFSSISERLYRIVRQTAKELNKKVNLEIKGARTELDRSVLEAMTPSFEHLLRNAIDHGIEGKDKRDATGKSETGEIWLDVRQQANELLITMSDDGAGLNLERIRQKAMATGLITGNEVISDQHIMQFIFAPGFSTAAQVTQLSGRGIGMDVVKADITSLGGRIEVTSEAGKGATFTIHLPLTLAVTQAVLVRAGTRIFAVPSAMVEQVQDLKANALEVLYKTQKVEWMGNTYPFHYLPRLLGDTEHVPEVKRYSIVLLLRSGSQRVAVHIDDLIRNQEIVVKNIGPQLSRVTGVAGATVLGNGQVVLILNPIQLAFREDLYAVTAGSMPTKAEAETAQPSAAPVVMVVDDSLTVRKITGRLLTREGYQVLTAKDGVDAMQQIQDVTPDVMLVDIEMPRMDGFELTRHIRGNPATKEIPIIMITSRTADKHRMYAEELGVNVYLGKPYQEDELLGHISGFVGLRKPR